MRLFNTILLPVGLVVFLVLGIFYLVSKLPPNSSTTWGFLNIYLWTIFLPLFFISLIIIFKESTEVKNATLSLIGSISFGFVAFMLHETNPIISLITAILTPISGFYFVKIVYIGK